MTGNVILFRRNAMKQAFKAGAKAALANPAHWREMFEAGEKKGSAFLNESVNAPGFSELMAERRIDSPGSFDSWIRKKEPILAVPVKGDEFEMIAMEAKLRKQNKQKVITPEAIEEAIRVVFNITIDDLRYNPRRLSHIKTPRFFAWYLAYHHCKDTLKEMGARWGGRDHATALHGAKKTYENCSLYPRDKNLLRLVYRSLRKKGYGMHYIFDDEDFTNSRPGSDRKAVDRIIFKQEEI